MRRTQKQVMMFLTHIYSLISHQFTLTSSGPFLSPAPRECAGQQTFNRAHSLSVRSSPKLFSMMAMKQWSMRVAFLKKIPLLLQHAFMKTKWAKVVKLTKNDISFSFALPLYVTWYIHRCMAPALLSPITKGVDQRKKCPFDQPDLLTQVPDRSFLLSSYFPSLLAPPGALTSHPDLQLIPHQHFNRSQQSSITTYKGSLATAAR